MSTNTPAEPADRTPYQSPPSRLSWAALGVVAAGVLVAVWGSPAAGVWTLAGLCVAAAAARVWIPENSPLAVRRRFVDVTILLVLGAGLGFLAATAALG